MCGSECLCCIFLFHDNTFFNHSVFWAWTSLLEHLVLLLPCTDTLLVNFTVCHKRICQREGNRKALMMPLFVSCLCPLNNNTKSLSFVVECIKPLLSIQCSWSRSNNGNKIWSFTCLKRVGCSNQFSSIYNRTTFSPITFIYYNYIMQVHSAYIT